MDNDTQQLDLTEYIEARARSRGGGGEQHDDDSDNDFAVGKLEIINEDESSADQGTVYPLYVGANIIGRKADKSSDNEHYQLVIIRFSQNRAQKFFATL